MSRATLIVVLALVAACGDDAPAVDASEVERCLEQQLGEEGWAKIPLSDTAQAVFGIDLGDNSATIYVEGDGDEVAAEIADIRAAEDEFGNTMPEQRVILRDRGNVLVSWANEPTQAHEDVVRTCVGFA